MMKSNKWSSFSGVISLKELGRGLFSPVDLLFVRSITAIVKSAHSGGVSI